MSNGARDIGVESLEALTAFVRAMGSGEEQLYQLARSIDGQVDAAGAWWTDRQYEKFRAAWDESFRAIEGFVREFPTFLSYLKELEQQLSIIRDLQMH